MEKGYKVRDGTFKITRKTNHDKMESSIISFLDKDNEVNVISSLINIYNPHKLILFNLTN